MKLKTFKIRQITVISLIAFFISCDSNTNFIDSQGNEYKTAQIGDQIWLVENLKFEVEENSFCYNNNIAECDTLGRIYAWEGAMEAASKIQGWHLPTRDEWNSLIMLCGKDSLGYENIISEKFGFNPQWSGVRLSSGKYVAKKYIGVNYWSSTEADTSATLAYSVAIMSHIKKISPHNYPKNNACAVRLIKD